MKPPYQIEICVDSFAGAQLAEGAGAHRLELAAGLSVGGLTPSWGLLERVQVSSLIDVVVLLRPRAGDFCYDESDMQVMERDIVAAKEIGVFGVALGVLQEDGAIDREKTQHLIEMARPLSVTFHRAFDMTRDLDEALETLIELGVDRVLSSGGRGSAYEGLETLSKLVQRADGRLAIMPGAGLSPDNILEIAKSTSAQEFHLSASRSFPSEMEFRNPHCQMGTKTMPSEYERKLPDPSLIRRCLDSLA